MAVLRRLSLWDRWLDFWFPSRVTERDARFKAEMTRLVRDVPDEPVYFVD